MHLTDHALESIATACISEVNIHCSQEEHFNDLEDHYKTYNLGFSSPWIALAVPLLTFPLWCQYTSS